MTDPRHADTRTAAPNSAHANQSIAEPTTIPQPPPGICPNCWSAYRSTCLRPVAIHCWHTKTVARRSKTGWKIIPADADLIRELRQEGLL
jgi:hypothetical protein